jgi:hypothetical protein
MVNHTTYINKRTYLPIPSQYLDFHRCVVVFIVVSDFEVRESWLNVFT